MNKRKMASRDFDDILEILKLGKWNHLYYWGILGLCGFLTPAVTYFGTYIAPPVNHTCLMPLSDVYANESDQCSYKYYHNNSDVEEIRCTEWTFNGEESSNTITADFELVCDNAYLRSAYQSVYMAGNFLGSLIVGYLADKYGRKNILAGTALMGIVSTFASTFFTNFSSILITRFLGGFTYLPIVQTGFILCMEVCEPKLRTIVGILLGLPWSFGTIWWGILGYLIKDWRWLQVAALTPGFLFIIIIWFIDESPRWLIVTGHHDRALQILKKAARWNKATLPPEEELLNDMLEIEKSSMTVIEANIKRRPMSCWQRVKKFFKNIFILFMTPELRRRTLLMYIVFVVAACVFYGLSLNAVNFQLNAYMYMVVSGFTEMPACTTVIPIVAKLGRRRPTVAFYLICGVTIMSLAFIPSDIKWLVITLAMVGKFCITASYNIIYLLASEVFPTEVRLQGLGTSAFISCIGSVLAPYITDSIGPLYPWVPSIVFGALSILAGVAAIFLPETLNKSLPETIVQLENEVKQQKLKDKYKGEEGAGHIRFISSHY